MRLRVASYVIDSSVRPSGLVAGVPRYFNGADAVIAGIADGSYHPFAGPINNQAGEQVIGEGEVLDDGVLLGMDWYVEGVEGELGQ